MSKQMLKKSLKKFFRDFKLAIEELRNEFETLRKNIRIHGENWVIEYLKHREVIGFTNKETLTGKKYNEVLFLNMQNRLAISFYIDISYQPQVIDYLLSINNHRQVKFFEYEFEPIRKLSCNSFIVPVELDILVKEKEWVEKFMERIARCVVDRYVKQRVGVGYRTYLYSIKVSIGILETCINPIFIDREHYWSPYARN